MKIKVGVIFGGESTEHEVSIISAIQAMKAMDQDKYDIIPIYISKERVWYTGGALKNIDNYRDIDNLKRYAIKVVLYLKNDEFILQTTGFIKRVVTTIDLAFPIIHGTNGEDGSLAGFLRLLNIPYVGSNIYGAVVGQDKVFMKQILSSADIPITNYIWFFDNEYIMDKQALLKKIATLNFPVIVKPATLGSSIGITKVAKEEALRDAIEDALQYDTKVIIEEVVANLVEVNCSILGNYETQQASDIEEVISSDEFLTYKDKYISSAHKTQTKGIIATNRIIPARLDKKTKEQVITLAKEVFKILNAEGVSRIDFLIDNKTKQIYVNEINTIPGSLSFYLWKPTGKNYTTLIDELITLAIKRHKKYSQMTFSFATNILENPRGLKGIKGKLTAKKASLK